jgi:hypothetical protein
MSSASFLAWSLLAAGVFALGMLLIRRMVVARGAPPVVPTGVQRVNMVFLCLFVSALCTKVICDTIDMPLPAWTRFVPGAMMLALGASFRAGHMSHGSEIPTRLVATIVMAMGALILVLEILRR